MRRIALMLVTLACISCGTPRPSAPSSPGTLSTDPKDLAEALLIGTGPLAETSTPCRTTTEPMVIGWRSGSAITVRVSAALPQEAQDLVRKVVDRVAEATLGNVVGSVALTDEVDPRPQRGEITVWGADTPAAFGCPTGAYLCWFMPHFTRPYIESGRIVGHFDGNYPHELGHAVFGFCHTRNPNVFEKETIMVAGWALTDRDVALIQSVYRAGLGPGATRPDLVKAGIINP